MQPLSVRLVEHGVVYPTIRVASHPGKLLMGVYDADDRYVDGTVLDRRSGEQGAAVPRELFPVVTDAEAGQAIYAGPLYFHFGHFLLESLARAWYASRHPDVLLAWVGQHDWQGIGLRPWQAEILDLLEIRNPTAVVTSPTRYALLHVPDLGYRYDDRFHPEHADFLARYEGPAQVPGRHLWLSRSRIGSDVRDLNAEPTERRLAEAGWTIAHPETTTVREQLDQLSLAEVVAGEEGSAFHTLVLLTDVASKRFRILRRHGREHRNLHTIGEARQVEQSFHSVPGQRVLRAEGREVSKISPSSAATLDVLGVPRPQARPGGSTAVDRLLARTVDALVPQSFLDVGAADAQVVLAVSAPVRVATSRRFAVDLRAYARSGAEFYELALPDYAALFHDDRPPFDVIRVTGADLREVLASFEASLPLARDSSTWVLGCGDLAAAAAVAVRSTHPGYTARRLFAGRTAVYLAHRLPGEPRNDAEVGQLSQTDVRRRLRWTLPLTWRQLRGSRKGPGTG